MEKEFIIAVVDRDGVLKAYTKKDINKMFKKVTRNTSNSFGISYHLLIGDLEKELNVELSKENHIIRLNIFENTPQFEFGKFIMENYGIGKNKKLKIVYN